MAAAKPAAKDKPAGNPGGKKFLIPIIAGVVLAAAIGGGAAWYFLKDGKDPEAGPEVPKEVAEHAAKPEYIALDPPFVVNLADASGDRYLQVEVQLMSRKPKIGEELELHMPVIRDRLMKLFRLQTTDGLRAADAIDKLQASALAEVNAILKETTGEEGIEALYFTSFVTQ